MKTRKYSVKTSKLNNNLKVCIVSDMHSQKYDKCLDAIKRARADIIICAGDMLERLDGARDKKNEIGFKFLESIRKIAPTYYVFGNHERFGSHREAHKRCEGEAEITPENLSRLDSCGVHLINDRALEYGEDDKILIGGLQPANDMTDETPDIEFVERFSNRDGFKILVSHQPEYYDTYLCDLDFDLIISGHTHGGQWKLFGKGIYAPNQGFLPKYSSGMYHNKMIVSAGASNPERLIPRLFNPCEIVIVDIKSV